MNMSRILHISDLHLGPNETIPGANPSVSITELFAEIIDRRIGVDCCLVTGDLAHGGDLAAYQRLKRLMNSCPWPFKVLPGNHDHIEIGREVFGPSCWPLENVWSWNVEGGCTIIGVNSARPGFHHGEVNEESLANLEKFANSACSKGPWILALHHPPHDVGHWWMDAEGLLEGRERLLLVSEKYQATAILCGHIHINSVVHRRGTTVPIITAPSVAHEVVYDDAPERPLRFRRRSPSALLHHVSTDRMVTVQLTTGGSSWLVEGKPWKEEVDRTNRRLPAEH